MDSTELGGFAEVEPEPYTGPAELSGEDYERALGREVDWRLIDTDGAIDGIDYRDDEEAQVGDTIQKWQHTPIVYGWAMAGTPQMLSDGLVHKVLVDTNWTSMSDFAGDLLGRCGRVDSTVDNSWQPCVLPRFQRSIGTAGVQWNWRIDWGSFGLIQADWQVFIDIFQGAMRDATAMIEDQTDIEFHEGDPNVSQHIDVYYEPAIPVGKVGAGYPFGAATFLYAADHILDEQCETPVQGVPNWSQLHAFHFADVYYTYNKGRIGIQWNHLWDWVFSCSGGAAQPVGTIRSRVKTILMHELAHVFGFAHQQLPTGNAGSIMLRNKSCDWSINHPGWNWEMRETIHALGTHRAGEPNGLSVHDRDLSCHSPLGGGEDSSQSSSFIFE